MTLSNSIFAVSGAATFLDARKDMSNLFACNTSMEPHPGLLTVGGSGAANGNVVVGMSNRMAVTVRPFQAVLNRLGALLIMNDGDVTVSLQAAPSANSRIDVVYVKQREKRAPISDSEDGPIIGVVTGTANLTPVAPHVPDGAVALAQVKVPSGVTNTTASGVVITQVYPFAATRGEELRFRSKGDMDAFAALDGTKAVTLSDNAHYVRNGNAWEASDTPQEMIVFAHSKVIRPSQATGNPVLYSESDLQTLAREHGVTGNLGNPCISVLNGDWNTTSIWITGVMRQNSSIVLNLSSSLSANTPLRVNSLIGFAR